ncbi:MAG TPA: hypothetical protein VFZ98_06465 [Vicinamibacterales bacterium]
MTIAGTQGVPVEQLIDETRAAREELHVLVEHLQSERVLWERAAAALPRRLRLTAEQRQRFRALLATSRRRRGC